jgi:hypothetical protein
MMDKTTLKNAAYHEAGHSVVWHLNGFGVDEVSIGYAVDDKGERAGGCHLIEPMIHYVYPGCYRKFKKQKKSYEIYKKRADRLINGLLAGPLAEKKMNKSRVPLYSNGFVNHGGKNDFIEAVCLAREFYNDVQAGLYIYAVEGGIKALLRKKSIWSSITKLAEALIKKKKIEGDELIKYLNNLPEYSGGI